MASLGSRHQNDPHWADGETGKALRGTWLVQGHIPGDKDKPSLNSAVSSDLGPWLHPGLPRAVGPAVLPQRMDMARGEGMYLTYSAA